MATFDTYEPISLPSELIPAWEMAATHRAKLFEIFDESETGWVYMKGASVQHRYDTDTEIAFRQESNFWYVSGVGEADFHLILDLVSREFHLFAPKRDTLYAVWNGRVPSREELMDRYRPDHLHWDSDMGEVLRSFKGRTVHCLNDETLMALRAFASQAGLTEDSFGVETGSLKEALVFCRLHKTEGELQRMRHAGRVNSLAHGEVLKALRPGMHEYEMKAVLDGHLIRHGLLHPAYNGIFASGENSAILHYVENTRRMQDGELFLIDSGFEYAGYSSDITRTWPVNGRFTADQRLIYSIVLEGQKRAIEAVKAGVKMEDLHLLTTRVMMEGLLDAGLLRGSIDEILEHNIFALFFPHGLGHFLGLDTHDPGGYPKGVERIDRPGIRYLRIRRELEPGMVITIEPGLYFIPALLLPAFDNPAQSRFLHVERLQRFLGLGGVRIEDNLVVQEGGSENLTSVVKEPEDVEAWFNG